MPGGASVEMGADIFDLVQNSIVLCDRGGRVTRWNVASEQIYGWNQTKAAYGGASADSDLRPLDWHSTANSGAPTGLAPGTNGIGIPRGDVGDTQHSGY
jgi:PAS domain-containing protein